MFRFQFIRRCENRRGVTLSLFTLLFVTLVGMVALTVDLGYIYVARGQAQCAADAAALAAGPYVPLDSSKATQSAIRYAGYNVVAGRNVPPASVAVEFGAWDVGGGVFEATPFPGNAVRVTIRRDASHSGSVPLFFGPLIGRSTFDTKASAVALTNPRDIVFVIDLSGSMNNDTEPAWATSAINNQFAADGYSTIGTELMQQLYSDFNFGSFPGTLQHVGQPLGVAQDNFAYAELTKNSGPLTAASIAATYRIANTDSEATRKTKAYKWIIDQQLATIMPNAKPTPLSSNATSYALWEKYLDYMLQSQQILSTSTKGKPRPSYPVILPPSQDTDRITGLGNPYTDAYPTLGTAELNGFRNKLGYRTFVQFMMDFGDDGQPATGQYVQLSRYHANCPWHYETTDGGTFLFPPREQPTHAARRALIATLQLIKQRNAGISDPNQMDQVAIVTYARATSVVLAQSLTADYTLAMQACVTLQAVYDEGSTTATENGLILAKNHIAPMSEGGQGRLYTNKIVVLLTDGIPNLYQSSNSTIANYMSSNPSSNWYTGSSNNAYNAALMQCMAMKIKGWNVYLVGLGLGTDYGFMDRCARLGGGANKDGQAPRGSGNPAIYEDRLKAIFNDVITNPRVRLVQ